MENLLREYMDRAFAERGINLSTDIRPVVTLSREFGCPSKLIARLLINELNKRYPGIRRKWRFISKEIVETTAKHLELNPTEVNYLLSSGGKGLVEDVLASFTPTYVSSHRMRKTITAVVRSIAEQGYVVIVGRGGAGILRHSAATLHVRLQAPRDWRIAAVCKSHGLQPREAARLVDETDSKRIALIELVTGEKFNPCLFDVTFNCQKLTNEEIIRSVSGLLEIKHLI
jgi:cytidylate kinase